MEGKYNTNGGRLLEYLLGALTPDVLDAVNSDVRQSALEIWGNPKTAQELLAMIDEHLQYLHKS